ncbi:hypothetical protein QEN19_003293 [Hanseniaspora menglaensis]
MNKNINPLIGSVVTVINEYSKTLEDEIDLKLHDRVQIILDDEEYNDGWYYGKNLRSNLIGLFPKCFTHPLNTANSILEEDEEDFNHEDQGTITSDNANEVLEKNFSLSLNDQGSEFARKLSSNSASFHKNNISNTRNTSVGGSRRVLSPLTRNMSQTSISTPQQNDVYSSNGGTVARNFSRILSNTSLNSPVVLEQSDEDHHLMQDLLKQSNVTEILEKLNINNWEPKDVAVYFYNKNIDLDSCLKFYDHKIDGKILLALELQDLKNELDILSFGTRYNINKEIEGLKQFSNDIKPFENDYETSSFSPSARSSRRSSLLLPAASVRNRSSSQSTNESVILNTNQMITGSSNTVRKSSVGVTGDTKNQMTRNGTQNYRSTSNNQQVVTPSQGLRGIESSNNNMRQVSAKKLPAQLVFESPRKAPQPPPGPSPVSNSLPKSPITSNFYMSPMKNNTGERIYSSSSNNNSASNMLKKSTSFLQRNLSFKSGLSSNNSRLATPNANNELSAFMPPNINKNNSSFSNNVLKTPKRENLLENQLNHDLSLTPKNLNNSENDYSLNDQSLFLESVKAANFNTLDTVDSPIYQPPKSNQSKKLVSTYDYHLPDKNNKPSVINSRKTSHTSVNKSTYTHRKSESGGSFLDLFNRLDSIHLSSNKNSPTVFQDEEFIQSNSSFAGFRSHNKDGRIGSGEDISSSNYMSAERPTSSIYAHSRSNTNGTNFIGSFGHSKKPSYIPPSFSNSSEQETSEKGVSNLSFSEEDEVKSSNDNTFNKMEYVDFDVNHQSAGNSSIKASKNNHVVSNVSSPQTMKSNTLEDIKKLTGKNRFNRSHEMLKSSGLGTSSLKKKNKKLQTSAFKEGMNLISCKESIKGANMHGWMAKKNSTGGIKGINTWKRRYFLLHGTRLSYYNDPNDEKERGLIDITGYSVVPCNIANDNNTDKLITLISSSVSSKNKYFFKIVPPKPGSKKGVNFTQQKVYYFSVEKQEETRAWMNNMLKATIDLDTSVPIISSYDTPTISLDQAKELLEEARNELLEREKQKHQDLHLSNNTFIIQSPQKHHIDNSEIYINDSVSEDMKDLSLDPLKNL